MHQSEFVNILIISKAFLAPVLIYRRSSLRRYDARVYLLLDRIMVASEDLYKILDVKLYRTLKLYSFNVKL